MKNRRTKAEIDQLDTQIRPLYEQGLGCRRIGNMLHEAPALVLKRVRALGIVRSVVDAKKLSQALSIPVPFDKTPAQTLLRFSATAVAIQWFMDRGYVASLPVEPTRYDLIVDSDEGLKRIQVKSTTSRTVNGSWCARTCRLTYDADSSSLKRRRVAYDKTDVDLFFIVTGDGQKYLIPVEATAGAHQIVLDQKYSAYLL